MPTQGMSDLSLNPSTKAKANTKAKKAAPVVDSWEDEDVESDTEPAQSASPISPTVEKDSKVDGSGFAAPPPTPSSPSYSASSVPPWQSISSSIASGSPSSLSPPASPAGDNGGGARRPEKTDAVARRMIASALGVRAPRATEEQRAYDRAVREKERKRREEEREAEKRRKEEAERAKAAIWND
ncbi:hypothetical protein F5Y04DRAFT_5489 [Hypomontagnella monticulosa]|nr:hypothetical protein F5Y04DRAFT_5489 [Hypomontagnella monticulosa]